VWNGTFFERSDLKSLGLRFQLGHRPGEPCPNPHPCHNDDFVLLDTSGIHSIGLDFCGCGASTQSHVAQLLRSRLFPATVINPKTAATFSVLKSFELLSYESKVSAFQYYTALSRLTDNTGLKIPKDRYLSLLVMIREWRHLKMLKRAQRGHVKQGIATTKPGECAVECPACPIAKKNMREGWRDAPANQKFLHAAFIGIDANFRLKRKDVSSEALDPALGDGLAYFVKQEPYTIHLAKHKTEVEPKSTCSRHDAMNLANSKPNQGLAATGVGTIECARHDMKRACSVGDLQVGERVINSDLESYIVSYDIACQWSVNLKERMLKLDHDFFIFKNSLQIRFFAYEAIDALRYNLQVRSHLFKFKDRFVRGQHANTRARSAINTVEAKIQAAAEEYRAAYKALDSLSTLLGHHEWRDHLRPLEKGDIRELSDADDERTSEGRRKISWIWMALGVIGENNDSDDLRDALRVEWCKSRARAMRFTEEVDLLTEEMERVVRYFTYQQQSWLDKRELEGGDVPPIRREGVKAYASRQAALCEALRLNFCQLWKDVPATMAKVQADIASLLKAGPSPVLI
ncbi:hypothetical protein H0H92_006699, partial [Tricholoma furcatifolium]